MGARALIAEQGHTRGTLAATRALARAGWVVGIAAPTTRGLAGASRHAVHRHEVTSPERDLDAFVRTLNSAIAREGYEVVFAGGDAEVMAISLRRDEIAAVVPYSEHGVVSRALDKLQLAAAAREAGLAVPETIEATPRRLRQASPPFLIKANLHAPLSAHRGPSRLEASLAPDRSSALRRAEEIASAGGTPLLQELVFGRLMAYIAVTDQGGQVVARAQQVAERTWPTTIGWSVRARTVPVDEELAERVAALLKAVGWFGIAQLQFVAPDGSAPRLIDLNGRFYGSQALAVAAGANLPAIWAALATGRPAARPTDLPVTAAPGVRYQWLEGDVRRAVSERRGGVIVDLASSLRYAVGAVHSVWSVRDPLPAARYLAAVPGRAAGRSRRGQRESPPTSQTRLRQTSSATTAQSSSGGRAASSLRRPKRS